MSPRLFGGIALATLIVLAGVLALPGEGGDALAYSPEPDKATTTTGAWDLGDPVEAASLLPAEPEPTLPAAEPATTSTTVIVTTTTSVVTTTTAPASSATTTTAPPPPPPPSGAFNSSFEASFAGLINEHRAASGLGALIRNSSLDGEARAWSQYMAGQGALSHSDLGRFLPPWSAVGENVAMGGSVSSMFSGLVSSSGHDANMLGDYTNLGVGVWVAADGTLWTTHIFTR